MLTDIRIKSEKAGGQPRKISDAGGLHLLIKPNGSKLWRFAYRYGGKQKTLAMGSYPLIGLKQAREKRDEAKRLLTDGIDPALVRKQARQASRLETSFKAVAEELVSKHEREGRALKTIRKMRWLLEFVYPDIGDTNVREVTPVQLLVALRKIEKRGRYETARRVRSTCGMVFRYAIATARGERDPSADLRDALITPQVKHRAAITDPQKIGVLLRTLDGYEGQPTTQAALRLAPHVFVRPFELRTAEWTEIALDRSEWNIPAAKMKMRRPHRVPLSQQAIRIIQELRDLGVRSKFLFPSLRTLERPMSENTVNGALRRMGYSVAEMTGHGFRAMASTRLNEMSRWNPDAIERQLAHQEDNDIRRAYMHAAEYWSERVEMMQAWSDYLDMLRSATNQDHHEQQSA